VGRFSLGFYWLAALSIVTAIAFVSSGISGDFAGWRFILLSLTWICATCFALWVFRFGQQRCWLSWDGGVWHVLPLNQQVSHLVGVHDCAMSVHLDLQQHMLISVLNQQDSRKWFWVSQRSFPERWHGFRCAVYSRSESILFH
jgi:hypothetical protein